MTLKEFLAERRRILGNASAGWNEAAIRMVLSTAAQGERPESEHTNNASAIMDGRNHIETLLRIIEMQDEALESLELGHEHGPTEPHCRPLGDSYGWCDYCHGKMGWGEDGAKEARAQVAALLKERR